LMTEYHLADSENKADIFGNFPTQSFSKRAASITY
jgi:hypothetical protein